MSLTKIAMAKRQRRYWGGGDVDPEGTADANRADSTAGVESQGGFGGPASGGEGGKPGEERMAQAAATAKDMSKADYAGLQNTMGDELGSQYAELLGSLGLMGKIGNVTGANKALGNAVGQGIAHSVAYGSPAGASSDDASNQSMIDREVVDRTADPMQSGIAQTTPAGAATADTGLRKYTWDPVLRQYVLSSLGAGANPMGYAKGQVFQMAAGGVAPSGIAAGAPRFVQGGGTGLSDSVPVTMDDGGQGRLADGEFVIPADVVSGLGGGSSKAGADMLYQMMERIRQLAHGSKEQIRPVDPSQVMPA